MPTHPADCTLRQKTCLLHNMIYIHTHICMTCSKSQMYCNQRVAQRVGAQTVYIPLSVWRVLAGQCDFGPPRSQTQ